MIGETKALRKSIRPAIGAVAALALVLLDMPARGQYPYQPNQNYGRTYPGSGYSGSPYTGSYGSQYPGGGYNPNTRGYSGYQGYSGSRYSSPYSGGGFGGSTFGSGSTFNNNRGFGSTFGSGSMFNNRGGSTFGSGRTGSTRYRDPGTGRYSSTRPGETPDRGHRLEGMLHDQAQRGRHLGVEGAGAAVGQLLQIRVAAQSVRRQGVG